MNVLMISIGDNILSNPIGDSLQRQLTYAEKLGHIDMIVYSPKKHNLKEKHYENLSIYPTKSLNMGTFVYDVLKITKNIIKEKQIDVITTQDPFGTALAGYFIKSRYNIPLHIQNHSSFLDNCLWINERPFLFRMFNSLAHFTLKKADRLRVVNSSEKKRYISIGINEEIIDVAPLPVRVDFWSRSPSYDELEKFRQKYNLNKPVLSWIGRNAKVKNLDFLFKTLSMIDNDFHVLIAGDMRGYWDLEKLEQKYGIKPVYLGILSHEELRVVYHLSDIYLNTSNYEGFGMVVADAQASGCAVVSRKTAGTGDIIENNKSGFLVENEEEFANRVKFLLENNDIRKKMGEYAKNMAKEKFDYEKMLNNIIESIKRTVK